MSNGFKVTKYCVLAWERLSQVEDAALDGADHIQPALLVLA